MNLQPTNLDDLRRIYFEQTGAARAAAELTEWIENGKSKLIASRLRDHRTKTVSSLSEMEFRSSVDNLMIYCGVLEIAATTGFVAPPNGNGDFRQLQQILAHPDVRPYYEKYYPVRLPQLLRRRLEGKHAVVAEGKELSATMLQFLSLDRKFLTTLNDCYLFALLDHFTIGGYTFADVIELFSNPEEYFDHLLLPEEEREVPDIALHQLNILVQFSRDLVNVLATLEHEPFIQSEIWHHYGYWYGSIGVQLRKGFDTALDRFVLWEPKSSRVVVREEITEELKKTREVIDLLTSKKFAGPVDALVAAS